MMRRSSALLALVVGALAGSVAYSPPAVVKAQVERLVTAPEIRRTRERGASAPAWRRRGGRPGWTVAEGKRRARKRRNQLRQKARR